MTIQIIRPADRAAWLAARSQDVTASVAAALVGGVHPFTTAYQIWASKTGRLTDQVETAAMRRGTEFEPVAAELFRVTRPEWTVEYPLNNAYFRDAEARLGATPDAFFTDPARVGTGVAQLKTTSERTFREVWIDPETDEINLPLYIAIQTIVEAELTGASFACVPVVVVPFELDDLVEGLRTSGAYDIQRTLRNVAFAWLQMGKLQVHVIDVPLHAGVKRRLRAAVREFWRVADSGAEPDPDWLRDGAAVMDVWRDSTPDRRDLTGDPEIDGVVTRYRDARATERAAKEVADHLRPRIIHALGSAEEGFTAGWTIRAPTTVRTGEFGQPVKSRTLRIKERGNPDARF